MRQKLKNALKLGRSPLGKSNGVFLKQELRTEHMLVLGRSGFGKTYFLENMIRQDILAGNGVCVIDPSGDLYSRLLNFCHLNKFKSNIRKRLMLINPQDDEWSVGLNYLEIFDISE